MYMDLHTLWSPKLPVLTDAEYSVRCRYLLLVPIVYMCIWYVGAQVRKYLPCTP